MTDKKYLKIMIDLCEQYKENTPILIRLTFVLGNLTTHFEDVRTRLVG